MRVLISIIAITVLTATFPAEAGKWRGRCHSQITGTDLGFVYADSSNGLTAACARIANQPIVSNIAEEACSIDDPFHGCNAGSDTALQKCVQTPAPNGATAGRQIKLKPFETGRSCVVLPKDQQVSATYCNMWDYERNEWCAFRTDTSGCSWIVSKRVSEQVVGEQKVICWMLWNESHDRERTAQIYVK